MTGDAAVAAALRALAGGGTLTADAAAAAFAEVMRGAATPTQIAALLMGLRVRGETPQEVAGVARALRAAMHRLDLPDPGSLVDTCGTGGGAVTTFNISTAAALVAAGAGARVAKHGNRSFTSRSGSADVLEALGVAIEGPVARLPEVLAAAGICFMFAPLMHPAMRHVGPIRRELAIPTVMNIVGPLANPAGVTRQVVGVADESRLRLIAGALAALGTSHALVVHGAPGMDEVSPLGPTRVIEVRDGRVAAEWTIDPAAFGLRTEDPAELAGGDPARNAATIEAVLRGGGPPGARAAVVLNAAAALLVGALAPDYATAVTRAIDALDTGRGWVALERLRRAVSTA